MSTVYISFHAPINEQTTQQLLGATFDQMQQGATEIVYLLSTPGGVIASGITLYNILKSLPVSVVMHNVGNIDSIGNAIFLAGKTRFACTHSTFMFHGVGFDICQGARLERQYLKERLDSIVADESRIGGIIADETALVAEEIDDLFAQANTKDARFALDKGFINEIRDVSIPEGVPVLQLVF